MNITLEADYAVNIVDCLAKAYPKRMDAASISQETGVTLRFSLKILSKLAAAKIVCSFKGVNGGYELACHPSLITLKDVIETVEGPFAFSRCLCLDNSGAAPYQCQNKGCRFQKIYDEISREVRQRLSEVTFEVK